ncbi:hypothetical protein ASPSYDRAFT_530645 [Aspergillus sydowii CBS 593.65]|uniref:Uncharacterized protein n=1 Tax=Aspergillus sydowii CBS 593.65 TaxID=1036612 RepID=A0A1L9T2D0_9EURO|nr:uncharacterized protein ASPSYDRAFT_530645 [Aspergillus sydowii CBS 593.65]OJJ53453.1 hypothetical protein ASPSYDRAFT_530645 [Aspergillus sydowii CBS 593.65]
MDRVAVRTNGRPIKRGQIASLVMHDSDKEESNRNGIRYADYKLVCYPWAVVEVKKPGATRTEGAKCILQAANGSSACASLLRSLHMERTGAADGSMYHHPVVAFTFVGEEARVFLTYNVYDRDPELDFYGVMPILYRMRCIWKGKLDRIEDALQIRRLLDNIHYWALHQFRADINSEIRTCLRNNRYSDNPTLAQSMAKLSLTS